MPVRTWRLLSGTVRELDVSDRVIGFYIDSDYVVMAKRRFASTRLSNGQRVIAAARRSMFIRSRWSVHGYRLADDQTIHTSGVGIIAGLGFWDSAGFSCAAIEPT